MRLKQSKFVFKDLKLYNKDEKAPGFRKFIIQKHSEISQNEDQSIQ